MSPPLNDVLPLTIHSVLFPCFTYYPVSPITLFHLLPCFTYYCVLCVDGDKSVNHESLAHRRGNNDDEMGEDTGFDVDSQLTSPPLSAATSPDKASVRSARGGLFAAAATGAGIITAAAVTAVAVNAVTVDAAGSTVSASDGSGAGSGVEKSPESGRDGRDVDKDNSLASEYSADFVEEEEDGEEEGKEEVEEVEEIEEEVDEEEEGEKDGHGLEETSMATSTAAVDVDAGTETKATAGGLQSA